MACNESQPQKLNIAVASNMQFAIKEISIAFSKKSGIECELIIGSSGKLTAQIKEGAPYDIFISADMKYPEELYRTGFSSSNPEIYAYGKLVMWSMIEDIIPTIAMLDDSEIKYIAIANPKMAPYGKSALEVLKHYRIYESIKHKLVYGESISQTNQFIISKAAEIGFTSKSVVLSPEMQVKGNWIDIDKTIYSPIDQGVVVLNRKNNMIDNAINFHSFLLSDDSKKILEKYGYSIKKNSVHE